jgi:hypothetical protein
MNAVLFSVTSPKKFSPTDNAPEPDVCLSNIGPKEQRKRLMFGIIAFAFGIALAAWLITTNANILWRLVLFVPFAGAGIGYFQARDKT